MERIPIYEITQLPNHSITQLWRLLPVEPLEGMPQQRTPLEETIEAELAPIYDPGPLDAAESRQAGDRNIEAGRIDEAIRDYRRAVKMQADDADHRTTLGDAYVYAEMSLK